MRKNCRKGLGTLLALTLLAALLPMTAFAAEVQPALPDGPLAGNETETSGTLETDPSQQNEMDLLQRTSLGAPAPVSADPIDPPKKDTDLKAETDVIKLTHTCEEPACTTHEETISVKLADLTWAADSAESIPAGEDGGFTTTITVSGLSAKAVFEGCTAGTHTVSDTQKITVKKSAEGSWEVAGTDNTVSVTCTHAPAAPKAPTQADLTGKTSKTISITHTCDNEACKLEGLTVNLGTDTWTAAEPQKQGAEEKYTSVLTIPAATVTGKLQGCPCTHQVQDQTVTATYENGAWTVPETSIAVSCTHAAAPKEPTLDKTALEGLKVTLNFNWLNGKATSLKDLALSDYPGAVSFSKPTEKDGKWTAVMTVDVSSILNVLSNDTECQLADGQKTSISLDLVYDSASDAWTLAQPASAALAVKVQCKKHQYDENEKVAEGRHQHTCTVCGFLSTDNWTRTGYEEPTYWRQGWVDYTCSVCKATYRETLPSTLRPSVDWGEEYFVPQKTLTPSNTMPPAAVAPTQKPTYPYPTTYPDYVKPNGSGSIPKTGDTTGLTGWTVTLGGSLAVLLALLIALRKRTRA